MDTSGNVTGDFSGGGRAGIGLRITNREFQRISRTDQSSMVSNSKNLVGMTEKRLETKL